MTERPDRHVGFLSGSPVRLAVLERLIDGVAQPADLLTHVDASRTTIHRTLTELGDREWIRRVDGGYAATTSGELALETYRETRARFRTLERYAPFLNRLEDAPAPDLEWLSGAALETATAESPHGPAERYADRLEEVDDERFRGVSPVINRQFVEFHEPIVHGGTETELVLEESTFQAVTEQYPEALRESLSQPNYRLYVSQASPSMGVTVYGEWVFLGAYDERQRLTAVLESTDPGLREWALEYYRSYRDGARRVTNTTEAPVADD